MNVLAFVSVSSLLIVMWLSVTFVREVPSERYPALGRGSVPISAAVKAKAGLGDETGLAMLESAAAERAK